MNELSEIEMEAVSGGDAAATRAQGTNSWGEKGSSWGCTQQITVEMTTSRSTGLGSCSLTATPPFISCTAGATESSTALTKNVITCTSAD